MKENKEKMRNERKDMEVKFLKENSEKDEVFKREIISLKNELKKVKMEKDKLEVTVKERILPS